MRVSTRGRRRDRRDDQGRDDQRRPEADPGIETGLAAGDFSPLMCWLRREVHDLGARYSTNELLERATGRPLDSLAFKKHLNTRYLEDPS